MVNKDALFAFWSQLDTGRPVPGHAGQTSPVNWSNDRARSNDWLRMHTPHAHTQTHTHGVSARILSCSMYYTYIIPYCIILIIILYYVIHIYGRSLDACRRGCQFHSGLRKQKYPKGQKSPLYMYMS